MRIDLETRIRNVTAVLGPTNTGKTHLAIERMLGHETGMSVLPLRLLAREVYDRIVLRIGADKVALVRSVHHDNGDHFAAAHWMATGRFGATSVSQGQKYPSLGSVVARVKGANAPGVPAYVGLPSAETVYLFPGYMGAAYLGGAYNPFDVDREAKYLGANDTRRVRSPKWLGGLSGAAETVANRAELLVSFDRFRRDFDTSGTAATSPTTRTAGLARP